MSMVIAEACINCGNCKPACPNQAISAGDNIYVIAHGRCTERVGAFDKPQCVDACPISDCISIRPTPSRRRSFSRATTSCTATKAGAPPAGGDGAGRAQSRPRGSRRSLEAVGRVRGERRLYFFGFSKRDLYWP